MKPKCGSEVNDANTLFPPEVPFPETHPGMSERGQPPIPVVFDEEDETQRMSLRAYAAIQLRIPESGIAWLDEMIRRSRKLDKQYVHLSHT
jgi:hypothetical protein